MKKNFILIFNILIFTLLFIFITPFFVNFIIELPNPLGVGFINDSNKDTWINFFGAIIGGGATLIGVWWTIKHEEQKRQSMEKKQMELLDKEDFPFPLFDLVFIANSNSIKEEKINRLIPIDSIHYDNLLIDGLPFISLQLYIYNLNSTTIFDLSTTKITLETYNLDNSRNLYVLSKPDFVDILTAVIPQNCKVKTELYIPIKKEYEQIVKKTCDDHSCCNIYIESTYKNKHSIQHGQVFAIHTKNLIYHNKSYILNTLLCTTNIVKIQ